MLMRSQTMQGTGENTMLVFLFFFLLLHLLPFCVHACRSTILQQQFNRVGRAEHGSVALPGVIRSGSIGTESLSMGTMPSPQQQITMGQMHRGHMPPLVRAAEWLSVSLLSVSSFPSLIIEHLSPVSPLLFLHT